MLSYLRRYKKSILIALSLCLVLFAGMGIGFLSSHVWSQNGRFRTFTNEIFEKKESPGRPRLLVRSAAIWMIHTGFIQTIWKN